MIQYELHINTHPCELGLRLIRALNIVTKDAVWLWHDKALPRHFRQGAELRYKYKKRSFQYQKYKRKHKGGAPALVFTGQSRDILTRSFSYKVTANKGIAVGKHIGIQGIRYFWVRKRHHPNKPAEMKATTKQEFDWIGKYLLERVPKVMKTLPSKSASKKIIR